MKALNGSRLRLSAVFLALAALLGLVPGVAHAESGVPCLEIGQDVSIAADERLDCDLVVLGGDVRIAAGGKVLGNTAVLGGDLRVAGDATLGGHVVVLGGGAEIGGSVDGHVFASGPVTVTATAAINGHILSSGRLRVAEGAEVQGRAWRLGATSAGESSGGADPAQRAAAGLAGLMLGLLFVVLVVALAPTAVGHVRDAAARRPWRTLLLGLSLVIVVPLLLVALLVTVIGPILLVGAIALALVVGAAGVAEALGRGILRRGPRLLHTLLGSLTWGLPVAAGFLFGHPAKWLGLLVALLWGLWALGAATVTLLGRRAWPELPAGSAPSGLETVVPTDEGRPVEAEALASSAPGGVGVEAGPAVDLPAGAAVAEEGVTITAGPSAGPVVPPTAFEGAAVSWSEATPAEADTLELSAGGPTAGSAMPDTEPGASAAGAALERPGDAPGMALPPAAPAAGEPLAMSGAPETGLPARAVAPGPPLTAAEMGVAKPYKAHQLLGIPGVTPIYAELLRQAGFDTVQAVASADPSMLAAAVSLTGVQPVSLAVAQEWVRQAQNLSAEGGSARSA